MVELKNKNGIIRMHILKQHNIAISNVELVLILFMITKYILSYNNKIEHVDQ